MKVQSFLQEINGERILLIEDFVYMYCMTQLVSEVAAVLSQQQLRHAIVQTYFNF